MFRLLYRIITHIAPHLMTSVKLPSFAILFAGPYFPKMMFEFEGESFHESSFPPIPLETLHVYGTKDEYKEFLTAHTLYSKESVLVYHDEGHKFPRAFAEEEFQKIKDYVKS